MIADTGVDILDIKMLSYEDASMKSFKVTVWRDDEERLMKPDAWPRYISCRRYVRPRRHNEDWGDRRAYDRDNTDDYGVSN